MNNIGSLDCKEAVAFELYKECKVALSHLHLNKTKFLDIKETLELYKACLDAVYNRELNILNFESS